MAEIELNVLIRQSLNRRIDNFSEMLTELLDWQRCRDNWNSVIDWQ